MNNLNFKGITNHKFQSYVTNILVYVIPLACGTIYLLSFYPGVMSFDSMNQWDQLTTFMFTNGHPAVHTIFMWILTRVWYSPAIIASFQIVLASVIIGYGLNSIYNVTKLPGAVFIAIAFLFSANPLVGIMDITLWKDVLYGFTVLLLTIYIFKMVISDGKWIIKPINYVFLGVILAFTWLIRFNGLPVALVSLIILLIIFKKYYKYFVYSLVILIAIVLLINGPVYQLFKVDRSKTQSLGIIFIHPIAAYLSSAKYIESLSTDDRQYLNQIYPLSSTWPYSCYDATVLFYRGVNFSTVNQDQWTIVKIFFKLAIQDPKIMIHHFLCLSSFVWQIRQPSNVYLETILFDNYNVDQNAVWQKYKEIVSQHSHLPNIRNFFVHLTSFEWHRDKYMILWRPAIYMYLFLASLIFLAYRMHNKKWLLLSIPLITQSIGIMFTTQLQALRYQYPVYIISMLFTLPLLFTGLKHNRSALIEIDVTQHST